MKKTITVHLFILIHIFFYLSINAQELAPCGTQMPQKTLDWLQKFRQNPVEYKSATTTYLPLQFHIVGDDDGNGYFPANETFRLLCEVNDQFGDVDMQFYVNDEFNYIDNSDYYVHDFGQGAQMMRGNNYEEVINVYMVADPAGNCGYFSGGPDALAVAKSCAGPTSTTLAHELGHYFSLPHTFLGWESGTPSAGRQERADGSNCASAGDFFCDTRADYIADRWACPYNTPLFDPDGNAIDPDETLYMSYALDRCTNRFSPEQMQAMRAFLNSSRSDLLNHTPPPLDKVGDSYAFYPAVGVKNIMADSVLLAWKAAPGATRYYLELLQYDDLFNGKDVKEYLTDTFYLTQLDTNVNYYWTVKPLSDGDVCSPSVGGSFKTDSKDVIYVKDLQVNTVSCHGANDGLIKLTVGGGRPPYKYQWSTGNVNPALRNLQVGQYKITVTDADGNSNVLTVRLPEPEELDFEITQTDNFQANIDVSGGTSPYLIEWSSGEIGANASQLAVGTNTVTITDANGCQITNAFKTMAIQANVKGISCTGESDAAIELLVADGTPPYTYDWSFNAAESGNTVTDLGKGIYSITVTDSDDNSLYLSLDVIDPSPLSGTVNAGVGAATANVSGGTPPYNYFWPNGFTSENTTSGLPAGDFEVIVSDANNCTESLFFTITFATDIEDKDLIINGLNIFPTLIDQQQDLSVHFSLFQNNPLQLAIFDSNGKRYLQQKERLNVGTNQLKIATNQLTKGLYFLQIQLESGERVTQKFIVLH